MQDCILHIHEVIIKGGIASYVGYSQLEGVRVGKKSEAFLSCGAQASSLYQRNNEDVGRAYARSHIYSTPRAGTSIVQ
jgi:hypothetical protein